jgi:hypothetical protein
MQSSCLQYQSLKVEQAAPGAQTVLPPYPMPPHWPQTGTWALATAANASTARDVLETIVGWWIQRCDLRVPRCSSPSNTSQRFTFISRDILPRCCSLRSAGLPRRLPSSPLAEQCIAGGRPEGGSGCVLLFWRGLQLEAEAGLPRTCIYITRLLPCSRCSDLGSQIMENGSI